jgi:hypothetical protein
MAKYKFKELKSRTKEQPLPEDCNEEALNIAERLKDEELKAAIKEVQTKKWFGTLFNKNEKGDVRAYFEFCKGICINHKLVKNMGNRTDFHMNVHNTKINFKKDEENV